MCHDSVVSSDVIVDSQGKNRIAVISVSNRVVIREGPGRTRGVGLSTGSK